MDSTTTQAPIPVTPEKQQEKVLFAYHENYTSDWYSELQDEEMTLYSYRGKEIKRAPKREYYIPDQEPPTYVWGQQIKNRPGGEEFTGLPMPDWMVMLKDKINMDFHVEVNHAIIIKYSDGVLHHGCFPPNFGGCLLFVCLVLAITFFWRSAMVVWCVGPGRGRAERKRKPFFVGWRWRWRWRSMCWGSSGVFCRWGDSPARV